jgi:hypothetical protein
VAAVLIAVLGVLGTLGGVALGASLGARHEERRWLRDKRLEAYVAFNHAAHMFDLAWSKQIEAKDVQELTATYAALNEHRDRLLILAPPAVQRATQHVVEAATRAVGAFGQQARVADGERPIRQFTDSFAELRQAQRAAIERGRRG